MSEIKRPREVLLAELAELDKKEARLEQVIVEIEDTPEGMTIVETGDEKTIDETRAEGRKVKRQKFEILVELEDFVEIEKRLIKYIEGAAAEYEEMGESLFIEVVMEDVFNVSLPEEEIDPRIEEIINRLVKEKGLLTFDSDIEE